MNKLKAFTIVELLVVIVVIGILATISIVSYSGISGRATLASLQSDLSNASTKLKSYQAIYGSYPILDGNNCPTAPTVDSNYCLKFSPGNSIATTPFAGYIPNNSTTPQTFSLTLSSNDIQGIITESSKPSILTPASLDPVADWIATPQGDHYGNYYDPVSKSWANVTRSTPKTIYDPNTQHIYDVPANYLAINPWSAYQPGGTGSAAVIEEARTNYLVNSYGAANTSESWDNLILYKDAIGTPKRSIDSGIYKETGQRTEYISNGDSSKLVLLYQNTALDTFTVNDTITVSFWIKGSATGVNVTIDATALNAAGGSIGQNSVPVTLSDNWQRVTSILTMTHSDVNRARGAIRISGIDTGDSFDITIDAMQLEKGAFATSYIPTTTITATRNKDSVTIPTAGWKTDSGTIIGVIGGRTTTSGVSSIMTWRALATDRITIGTNTTGVVSTIDGSDTEFSATKAGNGTIPSVASIKWKSGDNVIAYMNGIAGTPLGPVVPPIYIDNAFIGSYIASHSFANEASIPRLTIYSSALSDADIQTISNEIKDGL